MSTQACRIELQSGAVSLDTVVSGLGLVGLVADCRIGLIPRLTRIDFPGLIPDWFQLARPLSLLVGFDH